MPNINLDLAGLQQELQAMAANIGQGFQTLGEIGEVDVGASSKEVVYTENKLTLYHYHPVTDNQIPVPVLIVYALVNRPYMADLQADRSLIRGLLQQGLDIYLIDWGYPDPADRLLTLDDYINGYLDRCVDIVCKKHHLDALNLLGICQGGVFSLCYSALHTQRVRNLITTVTPVDFHTPQDMLRNFSKYIDVDLLVETSGNVSGELLNWIFVSLKPFRLGSEKYVNMIDQLSDREAMENFLRMEKWIFDSPDQAGECFRQFVKSFYQENALINGVAMVGDHRVDLKRVQMPVLNIYARDDHLVPPESSKALEHCVGTRDYTALEFPGGHIGIYVSGRSHKMIPPTLAQWLKARC